MASKPRTTSSSSSSSSSSSPTALKPQSYVAKNILLAYSGTWGRNYDVN
jgi:hypothetical protein